MRRAIGARFGWAVCVIGALAVAGCAADTEEPPNPTSDRPVDEPAPSGGTAPAPVGEPQKGGGTAAPAPSAGGGGTTPAPAPAPTLLASGDFVNKSYSGTGKALVLRAADQTPYVRLETLAVQNGPALRVYLTKEASPSSRADVENGFVDLGVLRSTTGNLTYTLPAGTDPTAYAGVIIYCEKFHAVFVAAALTPAS